MEEKATSVSHPCVRCCRSNRSHTVIRAGAPIFHRSAINRLYYPPVQIPLYAFPVAPDPSGTGALFYYLSSGSLCDRRIRHSCSRKLKNKTPANTDTCPHKHPFPYGNLAKAIVIGRDTHV